MRNRQGDFIWYELMSTDVDKAQAFYSIVLDWEIVNSEMPDMDYRLAFAGESPIGGLMRLPQEAIEAGGKPIWAGYIAVDDVDASIVTIMEAGGQVLMPATEIPEVGRIAMVTDPDGIPFYIMRGATDEPSDAYEPNKIGHCGWNELAAKDMSSAMAFYSTQFNWTMGFEMDMGPMGTYRFIERDGQGFGGIMQASEGAGPALWSFYFRVRDIEEAAEKVKSQGGKVLHGPAEVPGGDYIINGLDPQGVLFSLVGQRQSGSELS